MIKLWLLNHKEEIKETVELISAIHSQSVNGANTLVFECTNHVEKLDHVLYQDEQFQWHEFIVQGITENKESISVYAEHASYELHSFYVKDRRPTETPSSHLQTLLEGTRWSVGTVEKGEPVFVSYYYLTIYDAIAKLVENCKGELSYRITVSGNKITGRYVDILNRVGVDVGKRFTYRKDLKNVTRTILDDEIYTALVGRGRGEEIGDGYGRRITFADLDKPDSSVGIEYVFDTNALNQWGIEHNGQLLHRIGIVEFDDIEDKEELYNATKELLEKYSSPQVNYKVEVALLNEAHENVAIGDSVFIFDENFRGQELRLNGRIIRFEKNLVHPEESVVTIGQLIGNLATRQAQIENFINQFRSKSKIWDRSNAFDANNSLEASYIKNLLQEWNDRANASGGYTYAVEGQGQITYDRPIDQEPTQALQIVGGTMRIANSKLPNGDWNWRTVMNADGIAGQEIMAQSITANQLRSDVGASLDLSSNQSINLVVTNVIDDLNIQDGASAYEIAVSNGFNGTQEEWIESLKGADGTSVKILGTKAQESELPLSSNLAGDGYIIDGNLWVWTGTAWTNVGRIQGQNGKDGIGYQLILTGDDGLVFDSTTDTVSRNLRAKVYINNTDVTETLPNTYFTWTRKSNYSSIDNEFNAQAIQNKVLTLTSYYLQTNATYICTMTIPSISGYLLDNNDNALTDANGNKIVVTSYSLTFQQQITIIKDVAPQITTLRSDITQLAGEISLKVNQTTVDQLTNRVATAESNITLTQNEISSKVSQTDFTGANLVSMINQTPSSVQIMAKNIALEGLTTVNNSFTIGLDGSFSATAGTVGGWEIFPGFIRSVSGANNISIINHNDPSGYFLYTTNNSGNSQFNVSKLGVLKASGVEISGKITATSGSFSGTVNATSGYFSDITADRLTIRGSNFSGSVSGTGYLSSGTLGGLPFRRVGTYLYIEGRLQADSFAGTLFAENSWIDNLTYLTLTKASDIRLKENFVDVKNEFTDFILNMPIGTYVLKSDKTKQKQIGVNANLLAESFSDDVTQYILRKDKDDYYSVDYTNLIPMLVKTVQSLNQRVKELEGVE